MRKILTFLLFVLIAVPASFAGEHPSYDISAKIDLDLKKITASQKVAFTNSTRRETEDIFFHIYPNRKYTEPEMNLMVRFAGYFKIDPYPGKVETGSLKIQSVSQDGDSVPYFIEGDDETILRVRIKKPLKPGETVTLDLNFTADIPQTVSRYGWYKNVVKLSRWYPILSVYDDKGWHNYPFYPFHRPFFSEAAHYNVELIIDRDQVLIHSGMLKDETHQDGFTKKAIIESEHPIREFSLAMSKDYQVHEGMLNGIKIKSYYLPGDEYYGQQAAQMAKDMMVYFTELFGPYPYKEFSIAPVHLGYGGEQMSNLIFIDTRVYKLPKFLIRYFDFLIAHETAHQWLYNMIGINANQEIWIEEAIDSYFLIEHLEKKYGEDAELVEWPKWAEGYKWLFPELTFRRTRGFRYKMLTRIGFDTPIISKLSSFKEPSTIFSLAYGKGMFVVAMLKDQMGEEAFSRLFKRIYNEYKFRNISLDDFKKLCEEESGRELGWFFDQWLHSDEKLDYAVGGIKGNKIVFKNKGGVEMPAAFKATFKDGAVYTGSWDGRKEEEVYDTGISGSGPIKSVSIDPDEKLLDVDRTNNTYPRMVNVHTVPLYLGLYDIPLFLPDDAYNFVAGPEIISNGLGVKASFQKPYDRYLYASSGFEFGEELHHSKVGYQVNNLFETQTSAGFEIMNRNDTGNDDEDLVSGKVFLRRELWPVQYGLGDINDHISLYVLRNHALNNTAIFAGREDVRNISYSGQDEAIIGTSMHLNRSGTYPDPSTGYVADLLIENGGHFLGGTQSFTRAALDVSKYIAVTDKSSLALRFKFGGGYPDDKNLYQLGGPYGLRGFDRKTIRGANALLGTVEYRFPIIENIDKGLLDNIFGIESVRGVIFFDGGHAWFSGFDDSSFKRNAGAGLRFTVNLGGFLEKVILRADIAQPINVNDEPKAWVGINHSF